MRLRSWLVLGGGHHIKQELPASQLEAPHPAHPPHQPAASQAHHLT